MVGKKTETEQLAFYRRFARYELRVEAARKAGVELQQIAEPSLDQVNEFIKLRQQEELSEIVWDARASRYLLWSTWNAAENRRIRASKGGKARQKGKK